MHVNSTQNRQLSAVCVKPWDHKTDFLPFHLCSGFLVFRASILLLLPCPKSIWFIKAKGFRITRLPEAETSRPQGKIPCRHCYCFCCLYPSPTDRVTYGFHICLQCDYKNFSDLSCRSQQTLVSNGKIHLPVLPNKIICSTEFPACRLLIPWYVSRSCRSNDKDR